MKTTEFLNGAFDRILLFLPAQVIITYMYLILGNPFDRQNGKKVWTVSLIMFLTAIFIIQQLREMYLKSKRDTTKKPLAMSGRKYPPTLSGRGA